MTMAATARNEIFIKILLAFLLCQFVSFLFPTKLPNHDSTLAHIDTPTPHRQSTRAENKLGCSNAYVNNDTARSVYVFIVAAEYNCVSKMVVQNLWDYLRPRPRLVYVVLPSEHVSECQHGYGNGVRCLNERHILDVDMNKLLSKKWPNFYKTGRYGWYYQQFVKLLAPTLLGLRNSDIGVLWDADMILTSEYHIQINDKLSYIPKGGWHSNQYIPATKSTLGYDVPKLGGVVTHHIVFTVSLLREMLYDVCPFHLGSSVCVEHIILKIPNNVNTMLGFSEYYLYLSWALKKHPNVYFKSDATFKRTHKVPLSKSICATLQLNAGKAKSEGYTMFVQENKPSEDVSLSQLFKPSDIHCHNTKQFKENIVERKICMDHLKPRSCVVYSFGIANQWDFDIFFREFGCEVRSYDPSTNAVEGIIKEKHFFEKTALGVYDGYQNSESTLYSNKLGYRMKTLETIMNENDHHQIDILRLDVECSEWNILESLITSGMLYKIGQLSIEVHMWQNSHQRHCVPPIHQIYKILSTIPMTLFHVSQNTDPNNPNTLKLISQNITSVYELTYLASAYN